MASGVVGGRDVSASCHRNHARVCLPRCVLWPALTHTNLCVKVCRVVGAERECCILDRGLRPKARVRLAARNSGDQARRRVRATPSSNSILQRVRPPRSAPLLGLFLTVKEGVVHECVRQMSGRLFLNYGRLYWLLHTFERAEHPLVRSSPCSTRNSSGCLKCASHAADSLLASRARCASWCS